MKKLDNLIRKVCVVSGSRADYGILKNLIKKIYLDKYLSLQLIVTGQHLSPEFGLTYKEIEKDGFIIDNKVECLVSSDTAIGISTSTALGIIRFSDVFNSQKPDLIILLGDRFEIFSVSIAALMAKIPVVHIHGGELTEGAIDDALRHSITKMAHIHFVAALEYQKRVIQLGENPKNIHLVGSLAVDVIKKTKFIKKEQLVKVLKIKLRKKNLLVTFHPVTLENKLSQIQMNELIKSLSKLKDTTIIFTLPNSDADSRILIKIIREFTENNSQAYLFDNLGHKIYFSLIKIFDGVIGNSSSGLIEVPALQKGTINIGDRQKGRLLASSIINCKPNNKSITNALNQLYSIEFQNNLKNIVNPYQSFKPVETIIKVIKKIKLNNLIKKTFYNI
jgi:GDP/UDP-N,N'-diacetylbacillosamine 2-epimerase (hydrolysing)